jgi:Protein of unknown function (DUF3300)
MSLMRRLRKYRSSVLCELLIFGLIISTTPIIDGCSHGQEAPSAQPGAQESAPMASPSMQAPPPPGSPAPGAPGAGAPPPVGAAAPPQLATPAQLEQLVSPIALYPDLLVAQILAGSTFPNEITQAAQFMQQNPNLTGDALATQVNAQTWDPSVRSLCQFPSVLQTMNQSIEWTTALGNAYYTQPQDVLAAIQEMRRRARDAGTLKSTSQQNVVVESAPSGGTTVVQGAAPPQVIVIQPAQPNTVYVPTYNPATVYGAPVEQPPGYSGYSGTQMLVAGVVGFGAGVLLGSLINHGSNNWSTNWYGGNVVYNRNVFVSNSNYFAARYPGYRPGYPYPGYRPGYPGYPGNRLGYPGYPGYPGNRPGYPGGYPNRPGAPGYVRPMPYPNPNRPGYAANNPNNMKPNFPKNPGYANRPGTGNQARPGKRPSGNLPGTTYGANRPSGKPGANYGGNRPGGNKAGQFGRPGNANLAATKPSRPMNRPANNTMRPPKGAGGGNRGGANVASGNRFKGSHGGANKPTAKGGGSAKGGGNANRRRPGNG